MLVRIDAKGERDFAGEIGQYNVISKKLQLWFSRIYMNNSDQNITIKDFEMPKDVKKIELVDQSGYETLAVPISEFKAAYKEGKGYTFNYADWKKRFLKRF